MDLLGFLSDKWTVIWTNGLAFVFILSVIVFVHEMGHYLIARYNRVRVVVFSIGFGPELFGWTDRYETRWKVSVLPLGGYVKMFGDADASSRPGEDSAEMTEEERAVSFQHKSLGQRTAVVFGGPLANFVLAVFIFSVLFATVGQRVTPADIAEVVPGSPAEAAGVRAGDVVLRLGDRNIDRFETLQQVVREIAGKTVEMVVLRDGVEVGLVITPRLVEKPDRFGKLQRYGEIGVSRSAVRVRHDPLSAVWAAVEETASLTMLTLQAMGQMILRVAAAWHFPAQPARS